MTERWPPRLIATGLSVSLAVLAALAAGFERPVILDLVPGRYDRSVELFARGVGDAVLTLGSRGPELPYILPGPLDEWAGSTTHALRVRVRDRSPRSLRLELHAAETHEVAPPLLVVTANGVTVSALQTRKGTGLPPPHTHRGVRSHYSVRIPPWTHDEAQGLLLSVENRAGSWVMWERVRLVEAAPTFALAHLGLPGRVPPFSGGCLAASLAVLSVGALWQRPRGSRGRGPLAEAGCVGLALVLLGLSYGLSKQLPAVASWPRWVWLTVPWPCLVFAWRVSCQRAAAAVMTRAETASALGILAILLCIAFYDVTFGGRTLLTSPYTGSVMGLQPPYGYRWEPPPFSPYILDPGASAWQYEPLTAKASRLYWNGHLPLWNANQAFGVPLAANMHSSAFYFPALPLLLAPSPVMWDVYLLARLLVAGLFTFLLARALELCRLAALVGASAFMFSGYLLLWVNNSWLNVDVLLPALLYGIERIVQGPTRRALLFLAATTSAAVLGGMPESTFVVFVVATGYGILRLAATALAGLSRTEVFRRAGALAATSLLGVGTSGVLLVPFLEYLRHSLHGHTPDSPIGLLHLPVAQLITLFVPYIEGPPLTFTDRFSHYSGVVVPLLGLIAVLARRDRRGGGLVAFFSATAALAVAKAYGAAAINWIGALPLFNLVYLWKHLGVVICFSLAMLAALGLDALEERRISRRRASLAVILTGVSLLVFYWTRFGLPVADRHWAGPLGVAAALIVAVQLVLLWLPNAPHRGARGRAFAVVGCCAGLVLVELFYLAPKSVRPHRYPADIPPPAVRFVERDPGPHRVFALGRVLHPNTSSYFDLRDIRLVDALYPSRYAMYVLQFINPDFQSFTTILPGPRTRCQANRWFDLLGVKYLFASKSASPSDCGEGSTGSTPGRSPAYTLVWDPTGQDLRVYRNEQAFPRAFLVDAVEPVVDGQAALRRMSEATFDPRTVAVVEGLPVPTALAMNRQRAPGGITPAQFLRYEDSRVTLRAVTPVPALLILTDLFYPGWAASLDGTAVPIYPANYAFRGVLVPPGEHVVEFDYRPTSFLLGLGVSVTSLVLLVGFVVASGRWMTLARAPQRAVHDSAAGAGSDESNREGRLRPSPAPPTRQEDSRYGPAGSSALDD